MSVYDLFSKRQKRLRGEVPDVYRYDVAPKAFRVQVVHILQDMFGRSGAYQEVRERYYSSLHHVLCKEYGVFSLGHERYSDERKVLDHLVAEEDVERVLDVIELAFRYGYIAHQQEHRLGSTKPSAAVEELNARFKEHGLGYQFEENGEIVRVDSALLHEEAVKPALSVLREGRFRAANEEFLKGHEHYRHGEHGDAINECLKAFESVLKVICATQRWDFDEKDTAKKLLDVVFSHGLIPAPMQSAFGGLRSILESAVPTTRNRMSGHGAGLQPKDIPEHIVGYVLHVTASSIVLLAAAERAL